MERTSSLPLQTRHRRCGRVSLVQMNLQTSSSSIGLESSSDRHARRITLVICDEQCAARRASRDGRSLIKPGIDLMPGDRSYIRYTSSLLLTTRSDIVVSSELELDGGATLGHARNIDVICHFTTRRVTYWFAVGGVPRSC